MILLPASADADAGIIFRTRAIRAFVDGIAFVVFPVFLIELGLSATRIGVIVTSGLAGSAILTLGIGAIAHRVDPRRLLIAGCLVMMGTGFAYGIVTSFWVLLVVSLVTTMNTSAGDVSPFLPLEQSLLSDTVDDSERTSVFARFNLVGSLVGSLGALSAGIPVGLAVWLGGNEQTGRHASFVLYGLAGVALIFIYRRLSPRPRTLRRDERTPLGADSRRTVFRLSALFSLDSLGGGFATQSIFALWVLHNFGVSTATLGSIFFAAGILSAFSSLVAVKIAARIGLVRTMAYTHIPASVLLVLVALAPNVWVAMALFIARGFLSQMDVPARTSYVMAVVRPNERAAAASITNVPRSLAAALPPVFAGWMLDQSNFGWPLIVCAVLKITYDVLLLMMFRELRPPEEQLVSG